MKTFRVLVISDEKEEVTRWYEILQPLGVHTDHVSSQQVLESPTIAVRHDIAIIDTDDKQNTLALCHALRPIRSNPILLFADTSDPAHLMEGYAAGADECTVKTLGSRIIQAKIRAWCRRLATLRDPNDGFA
jgi:DNA-binding response OmpR family regulator